MTTTTYLVPAPRTPEKQRDRLGGIWHNDKHLTMGMAAFTLLCLGGVSTLLGWFLLLSIGAIGGGALMLTAPGYYGYHKARGHVTEFTTIKKIDSNPKVLQEWSDEIQAICEIHQSLRDFVMTLDPNDFAYDSARGVVNTVEEQLWEAIAQFRKMEPFLRNQRETTKDIIAAELKQLKITTEKLQLISDQTLHLSIRSATFIKATPKDHLDILARELESMCLSLEELEEGSSNMLPAVSTSTEIYGGRSHTKRSTLETLDHD